MSIIVCGPRYEQDSEGRDIVYDPFNDWDDVHNGWFYVKTCSECGVEMRMETNLQSGGYSHYLYGDWWGDECPSKNDIDGTWSNG